MHQVLFYIPVAKGWLSPDGIPVYGFGAMLFLTFVLCTLWGTRRGKAAGMPPERFQDMEIWLFLTGLVGARLLYMIQYPENFQDRTPLGLFLGFFRIWEGGIIFYGSVVGGVVGFLLFYRVYRAVLRRLDLNVWRLADAVAPLLALGLAIGRIGCYLNGCCWGQIAIEEACPIPIGAAHFPLLPAPTREQFVDRQHLQTSTGFTLAPRDRGVPGADPRSVVQAVEPRSPAAVAGVAPGDRIIKVNGEPNGFVVEVRGAKEYVEKAMDIFRRFRSRTDIGGPNRVARAYFDEDVDYIQGILAVHQEVPGVTLSEIDSFGEMVRDWPRGKNPLALTVRRGGIDVDLPPFVPRTVGLYPTQLYETVSMVLLIGFLLAYYPFRRHDGELMVLCMVGYAIHRFINESIRIEPVVGLGLTLSQWGSVVIFTAAAGMEVYLWRVMPSRWAGARPILPVQTTTIPQSPPLPATPAHTASTKPVETS